MQLGARAWQAAAGASLWALHPLRVESFAWVAERKDVLCALFFVATIAAYLGYQKRPSAARYAGWLCCGALALMSKPTAVTLPLILLLLDVWPARRKARLSRLVFEKIPLVAMTAVVSVLTVIGQQRDGATRLVSNLGWGTRFGNAVMACSLYLGKMLWPLNLACHYPYRRELPSIWGVPLWRALHRHHGGGHYAVEKPAMDRDRLGMVPNHLVAELGPDPGRAPGYGGPFHPPADDRYNDRRGLDRIRLGWTKRGKA
jgi:hypothetical protein